MTRFSLTALTLAALLALAQPWLTMARADDQAALNEARARAALALSVPTIPSPAPAQPIVDPVAVDPAKCQCPGGGKCTCPIVCKCKSLSWRRYSDDTSQVALYGDGVQVGGYSFATETFRPLDGTTWLEPCACPIEVPALYLARWQQTCKRAKGGSQAPDDAASYAATGYAPVGVQYQPGVTYYTQGSFSGGASAGGCANGSCGGSTQRAGLLGRWR